MINTVSSTNFYFSRHCLERIHAPPGIPDQISWTYPSSLIQSTDPSPPRWQSPDSNLSFPGPRHLSHRAQRRRQAFQATTLRKSQRQRPPPPLARLSSHQLWRYLVSRPSHRPSRSSSEWLRIWQRSLLGEHAPCLPSNHESREQSSLTQDTHRPTSRPNQPTTASPTPPVTPASFSFAKLNSASRCSNSKLAALTPRSWPDSTDASPRGVKVPRRLQGGKTQVA